MKPLAIDLFCGLGGWTEGLLAEGYYVVGFDIERHDYGTGGYPAQLVLQDALTLHGKQFKDAALIVASPPCQEYSYMAMPWSRAKQIEREYLDGTRDISKLTALFDACFRIQREAIEAAGHFIPLVVENVRGAQKWVGRSRWNYGSYHLWGDVPALMPMTKQRRMKSKIDCAPRLFSERVASTSEEAHALHYRLPDGQKNVAGEQLVKARCGRTHEPKIEIGDRAGVLGAARSGNQVPPPSLTAHGHKVPGFRFDGSGKSFQMASVEQTGQKTTGHVNKRDGHSHTRHLTNQAESDSVKVPGLLPGRFPPGGLAQGAIKNGGDWFDAAEPSEQRRHASGSKARKAASAAIAKIPFPLARHIAHYWKPPDLP